jgi:uncharacterized integral membrane protein
MKYVRMIVWILLLVALVAFSVANWRPVEVKIWDSLILETKIPALVVVAFLLGLVPMWLVHRGMRWRLQRRISALESAHRHAIGTPVPPPPSNEPTVGP